MIFTLYQIVRTARPRQWLKNVSLFAAPLFAGALLNPDTLALSLKALVVFCGVSSAGYIINDLVDAPKDRMHPVKKNRPIASGKLGTKMALAIIIILIASLLTYSLYFIGSYFTVVVISYIIIQIVYSFYLRDVIILDAMVVASLFILRVFAGGLAAEVSVSSWLILTTIGLSLLLAFGKRRSEKTILLKYDISSEKSETRKTLKHYPDSLLDSMISMSSAFCIITYALFTFQISPTGLYNPTLSSILPSILRTPKLMMLTIPFVIYGVARYLYVIYEKKEGESPERVLLSDKALLTAVIAWCIVTFVIIYVMPNLGTIEFN